MRRRLDGNFSGLDRGAAMCQTLELVKYNTVCRMIGIICVSCVRPYGKVKARVLIHIIRTSL